MTKKKKKYNTDMPLSKAKRISKTLPKTKRMRKKNYWLFCDECNCWFNRFDPKGGTCGINKDKKYMCNKCLKQLVLKTLTKGIPRRAT